MINALKELFPTFIGTLFTLKLKTNRIPPNLSAISMDILYDLYTLSAILSYKKGCFLYECRAKKKKVDNSNTC